MPVRHSRLDLFHARPVTVQPALLKHRLVPLRGEVLAQPSRLDQSGHDCLFANPVKRITILQFSAEHMFKPPPPIPPGSLQLLSPQGIQWTLGAQLTLQQARLVHPVSHTTYYHMLERERILASYHEFIDYPCLFHHASPLPDGGLRMWFIMGHTPWDWQRHNCYVIWWCCDLRQAFIMR